MAKTYIDTVKYLVYTNVEIGGLVEKPDVVGAIFGQTEGLLGDELDLRDLQKNGRIGRIEVDLSGRDGKTTGVIKIPSSLDMVETCIIAAALETVDRVGPCEARLKITKVEDTRNQKRKQLVDRAKLLLKTLLNTEIPESKEISQLVRDEVKTAEIVEYGPDRLPSGPTIDRSNEVVFVEGRADVVNMLKNDITNVIAIGGAKVTRTIVELSKRKEVTLFLDGDRGGDIILNELAQGGVDIDFVSRAPAGLEVEELTRKELIKYLRNRTPFEQTVKGKGGPERRGAEAPRFRQQIAEARERDAVREETPEPRFEAKPEPRFEARPEPRQEQRFEPRPESRFEARPEPRMERPVQQDFRRGRRRDMPSPADLPDVPRIDLPEEPSPKIQESTPASAPTPLSPPLDKEGLMKELDSLANTLKARFYNGNFERIGEVPVRDVIKSLSETNGVHAIVFDGIITQRLADLASKQGVKLLIGLKIGNVNKVPDNIEIVTKSK
ncbi:MAG: DNA primase DnaG [Candidatus ainarchaeum sp.]|nr:DNA primase DnaG [Candidatus ainarchaeum sp.]